MSVDGDIVGQYESGGITHGFLLRFGAFTTIDIPDATSTIAAGINAQGEIVGEYTSAGVTHGFLLSGGVITTIGPRPRAIVPGRLLKLGAQLSF